MLLWVGALGVYAGSGEKCKPPPMTGGGMIGVGYYAEV